MTRTTDGETRRAVLREAIIPGVFVLLAGLSAVLGAYVSAKASHQDIDKNIKMQENIARQGIDAQARQSATDYLRAQRQSAYADLLRSDRLLLFEEFNWIDINNNQGGTGIEGMSPPQRRTGDALQILRTSAEVAGLVATDGTRDRVDELVEAHRELFRLLLQMPASGADPEARTELDSLYDAVQLAGEQFSESGHQDLAD